MKVTKYKVRKKKKTWVYSCAMIGVIGLQTIATPLTVIATENEQPVTPETNIEIQDETISELVRIDELTVPRNTAKAIINSEATITITFINNLEQLSEDEKNDYIVQIEETRDTGLQAVDDATNLEEIRTATTNATSEIANILTSAADTNTKKLQAMDVLYE